MVAKLCRPSLPSPSAGVDRVGRSSTSQDRARYDAALVGRFNAGDDAAFDEITMRYREKISAIAFTVLRNHDDADEIAQTH